MTDHKKPLTEAEVQRADYTPVPEAEIREALRMFEVYGNRAGLGYMARDLALELLEMRKAIDPVKVTGNRWLRKGYGYCTCTFESGAPFIVSSGYNFCPNCGHPLKWPKSKFPKERTNGQQ